MWLMRQFDVKPASVHFVSCPKQGRDMEADVLHRVGFVAYSCPQRHPYTQTWVKYPPPRVCMHLSAFLSMAKNPTPGGCSARGALDESGSTATKHSLLAFHCLISEAAHTTCGRNVNFPILFRWYSTLINSFDAKFAYAAGLPMLPLLTFTPKTNK